MYGSFFNRVRLPSFVSFWLWLLGPLPALLGHLVLFFCFYLFLFLFLVLLWFFVQRRRVSFVFSSRLGPFLKYFFLFYLGLTFPFRDFYGRPGRERLQMEFNANDDLLSDALPTAICARRSSIKPSKTQ